MVNNNINKIDKIPRRSFLQALGIVVASAVATKLPLNTLELDVQPTTPERDLHFEVLNSQIGNLNTTVLLTEHDDQATKLNFRKIVPFLNAKNQIIIPEYFPPDYLPSIEQSSPFIRNRLESTYKGVNTLFNAIEKYLVLENNVDVRVLDPAYSNASIYLRLENNWPFAVDTLLIDSLLAEDLINRQRTISTKNDKFRNHKSIMEGAAIGLNTLFGAMFTQGSNYGTETMLRRVFIAKALKQLGSQVEPGTNATLIYPPDHWHGDMLTENLGIKHFLEDDNLLNTFFEEFSRFRKARNYQDLYHTRRYVSKYGGWDKLPGFELT